MAHVQAFSSFLRVGRQLPRSEAGVQSIRVKSPRRWVIRTTAYHNVSRTPKFDTVAVKRIGKCFC
jgi:hypothetical protein